MKLELEDLRSALADAERTTKLHLMQEQVLKEEIRELERAQKREGSNIGYLSLSRARTHAHAPPHTHHRTRTTAHAPPHTHHRTRTRTRTTFPSGSM